MKFPRPSFSKDDGTRPSIPGMHLKMPSLRRKESKAILEEKAEQEPSEGTEQLSRRKTIHRFLKTTGANIKATGDKLPMRLARTNSRVAKQPLSTRNSQVQYSELNDEVLDRIMGVPKPSLSRGPSENFLLKQKIRANSRQASSIRPSPLSEKSQAELDRKSLTAEEIITMFIGAPCFNVEGRKSTYKPQVIFRGGDVEASARYGMDYAPLRHPSFGACTLGLHKATETADRPPSSSHETRAARAGNTDFLEVPSMLSAQGNDPGTVGFDHYLQLPIADSTVIQDESASFEKRELLYSDPEQLGLRDFNLELLVDRLTELGEVYLASRSGNAPSAPFSEGKVSEMGEELFGKLLSADWGLTPAGTGSVSLKTQINALQELLNTTEVFYDFSLVDWRIRVAQLLWASADETEPQLDENREPTERDVLLLQITLAAELLVRLDALKVISAKTNTFPPDILVERQELVGAEQTKKVKWDLLLAQRFLENLTISATKPKNMGESANRNSFFSAISFFTAKEEDVEGSGAVKPLLYPKNATNQLAGLLYFAEAIGWPHQEDVSTQLKAKLASPKGERPMSVVSVYATPPSSPGLALTPGIPNRNSYLAAPACQQSHLPKRPGLSRVNTVASMQLLPVSGFGSNASSESFEVSGWLSRSWLAGLVLPGEVASHFLISTLLENSPQAIDALGDCANLYGGFVYKHCSFWSKSCVVGRVLAATCQARECMGWVSVPLVPRDQPDGWIDLDVKEMPYASANARITEAEMIEADSEPLHSNSAAEVQAGDFTTPVDGPPVMGNEVRLDSWAFVPSGSTSESPDTATTSVAQLTFSSPINTKLPKLIVTLTYDAYFVSSYPCYPQSTQKPNHTQVTSLDRSNTVRESQPADSARQSASTLSFDKEKELPPPPAHPLHIDYRYSTVPVATLLSAREGSHARALSSPAERPQQPSLHEEDEETVILDCRGSQDLQLLARAWCSKVGENAVVSKHGRTCLACSVREAKAIGVGVVIRI